VNPETLLEIRELSKSLDGVPILHDISLEVRRGDFCGLIGPNGSGKTTLLRSVTGQLTVAEQRVSILGKDVATRGLEAKTCTGYAFEPNDLPPQLSGMQLLDFVGSLRGAPEMAGQIRELSQMLELSERLDDDLRTYSHGMKQKLGVMMALIGTPPLIVMDESLNGLDPVSAFRLKQYLLTLAQTGRSGILLSSHQLDSLERYCTRIIMMRDGRLVHEWTRAELEAEMAAKHTHLEEIFVDYLTNLPGQA